MRKKSNFKKRPKDDSVGLSVKVYNNNVDTALKIFKRKVKDSNLMVELRDKQYYKKPSAERREKKMKAISRERYKRLKENESGK